MRGPSLVASFSLDLAGVPSNQAEMMVAALKEKGLPVAYIAFEGERHGFRKAETVTRPTDTELYFYSKILGFDLPVSVEPVDIANFHSLLFIEKGLHTLHDAALGAESNRPRANIAVVVGVSDG